MKKLHTTIVPATLALMLTACGGGGDDGPPTTGVAPVAERELTRQQALQQDPDANRQALHEAATATPRFESVTQSTSQNVAGVSTDAARASVSIEGAEPRIKVTVTRDDGSTLSLDTLWHAIDGVDVSEATTRPLASAFLLNHSATELTYGKVIADWSSDDPTDYLAGGYWIHATGDIYGEGGITGIEGGAFVDGTEMRGTPDLPLTGTASYNGMAAGAYGARYGTDFAGVAEGTEEVGDFEGQISLTADLDARNISGRVDNIDLAGFMATPSGEVTAFELANSGYEIDLGATPFGSDGTFTGRNVELIHPNLTIDSEGSWGGRFSTMDDSAGNPRRVAGTLGGTGTTQGGSSAEFVGAFYGNTPQFEADVSR